MEEWIGLQEPFDRYSVSNQGRVKNTETGYIFNRNSSMSAGYERVRLTNPKGKDKYVVVHKLVAEMFIKNPQGKEEINHINQVRNDNRVENLEWVTRKENCNRKRQTCNKSRAVEQYTLGGEFIRKWDRISDIPFGSRGNISSACSGRLKHAYGFCWKYYEEKIDKEIWRPIVVNGFEIEVSDNGRVKLLSGKVTRGFLNGNGYYLVNVKAKGKLVHRLVAECFLDKTDKKDVVDHIDRDKTNNHVNNLRWSTHAENRLNVENVKRNVKKQKIYQIFADGSEKMYESMAEASRCTGISSGNIWMASNGQRRIAGGYKWRK